ncbi:hypothetical protein CGRA01v4_03281 [Colletotrichum graminicola]|nr:hypothetical protein CGRA01v4_03281 [Colletotrichum graminicola]
MTCRSFGWEPPLHRLILSFLSWSLPDHLAPG